MTCGGLRTIAGEGSVGAIKRVYVMPEARGKAAGTSGLILLQPELPALERG